MISNDISRIKSRLANLGLTQVNLVSYLYESGRYDNKSSLKVQVSYLIKGTRFNTTSQALLNHINSILDALEDAENSQDSQ